MSTTEDHFDIASTYAMWSEDALDDIPHGQYRDYAIDNLKAAIGWIKQARDEWATRKAGQ